MGSPASHCPESAHLLTTTAIGGDRWHCAEHRNNGVEIDQLGGFHRREIGRTMTFEGINEEECAGIIRKVRFFVG